MRPLLTPDDRRRLDRIRVLWRQLDQLPDTAYQTAAYQTVMTQIRAEVDAWARDRQTAVSPAA